MNRMSKVATKFGYQTPRGTPVNTMISTLTATQTHMLTTTTGAF